MFFENNDKALSGRARGRLAPSPTGLLHLGNAYAFLVAWLSVRKNRGEIVLRIEDIDPDRSRAEFSAAIIEDLKWLGIDWDEGPDCADVAAGRLAGPYVQSARLGLYDQAVGLLLEAGRIYPCYCTRKELRTLASAPHVGDEGAPYPGLCRDLPAKERRKRDSAGRKPSLRLRAEPEDDAWVCFDDRLLGPVQYGLAECGGDFAVRRSDGVVSYQLAAAVDDALMGVTEVVRGRDLAMSTPRQLLILRLLGRAAPRYAHIPLLHDHNGERLAKRHKSLELRALRDEGVRPEQVVGYLAHLAGIVDEPRQATPRELAERFDLLSLRGRELYLPADIGERLRWFPR